MRTTQAPGIEERAEPRARRYRVRRRYTPPPPAGGASGPGPGPLSGDLEARDHASLAHVTPARCRPPPWNAIGRTDAAPHGAPQHAAAKRH